MASVQLSDIVLTAHCRQQMQMDHIAIGEVLGTLNTPKRIRKANPTSLTDSVWRAETNSIRAYYRWSSRDHKWIILMCWRYSHGRARREYRKQQWSRQALQTSSEH